MVLGMRALSGRENRAVTLSQKSLSAAAVPIGVYRDNSFFASCRLINKYRTVTARTARQKSLNGAPTLNRRKDQIKIK